MALGSVVLGTATLGIGLLVGGIIFNVTGSSLSKKADEAWNQMLAAEKKIKTICAYLSDLNKSASVYHETLNNVAEVYYRHLNVLDGIVTFNKKTDWNKFTEDEKLLLKNTVMLVQLLYTMCQVKLVYLFIVTEISGVIQLCIADFMMLHIFKRDINGNFVLIFNENEFTYPIMRKSIRFSLKSINFTDVFEQVLDIFPDIRINDFPEVFLVFNS